MLLAHGEVVGEVGEEQAGRADAVLPQGNRVQQEVGGVSVLK